MTDRVCMQVHNSIDELLSQAAHVLVGELCFFLSHECVQTLVAGVLQNNVELVHRFLEEMFMVLDHIVVFGQPFKNVDLVVCCFCCSFINKVVDLHNLPLGCFFFDF